MDDSRTYCTMPRRIAFTASAYVAVVTVEVQVIIQSTDTPSALTLTASGDGLKTGTLTVSTVR